SAAVWARALDHDGDGPEQRVADTSTVSAVQGNPKPTEKPPEKTTARAMTVQDAARVNMLHVLQGHQKPVTRVAFAPSGQFAATGDEGGAVILWEPASGKLRAKLPAHRQLISGLGFSADSKMLFSVSADAVLKRWDVEQGKETSATALPIKGLQQAVFTPDGASLATTRGPTGSGDLHTLNGEIQIWDTAKGVLLRKLPGHSELTNQLLFSADGATLLTFGTGLQHTKQGGGVITTSADSIKLWDFKKGEERASFPAGLVTHLGLSPDAKLVALEGMSGPGRFPV